MSDWKNILKTVAPTIATALGGPMAGTAVRLASQVLLGKDDGSEDEIAIALATASPDKLLELKKVDNDYKVKMAEIEADDRNSARRLYKTDKKPQITLSTVYTVGYFAIMAGMLTGTFTIPEGQEGLMSGLLGVLTAAQIQIMNFWFGSSSGSKDKINNH